MRAATLLPVSALLAAVVLGSGCSLQPVRQNTPAAAGRAADVAVSMVGKPYRYGGNSPVGFDCSGLVQYSYGRAGVRLPHGTDYLRRYSYTIPLGNLQRGDLVFFDQQGKRASHVGIYLGNEEFVHAPSSGKYVRVVPFSDYWQNHFAEARRVELD